MGFDYDSGWITDSRSEVLIKDFPWYTMGRYMHSAKIHSGRTITALNDRILCKNMDLLVRATKIVIPEHVKASIAKFGHHKTGRPHAVGLVMAIGPKVKGDSIRVGDYLLIDALNSSPLKVDGKIYLFARQIAVLCAISEMDVMRGEEDKAAFKTTFF